MTTNSPSGYKTNIRQPDNVLFVIFTNHCKSNYKTEKHYKNDKSDTSFYVLFFRLFISVLYNDCPRLQLHGIDK